MSKQDPGEIQNLDTISGASYAAALLAALAVYFSFYVPVVRQGAAAGSVAAADTPWLQIHIAAYLFAYLLLLTGFLLSVLYAYVKGRPRLPWVEIATVIATLLAVTGLLMGMVFARITWGAWWVWDNKNTFALFTVLMLVILTPLAAMNRSFGGRVQRDLALFIPLLLAVILMLSSYFVSLLFPSNLHPVWLLQGLLP